MEKPVVTVGNQMEQSFLVEIVREKRNTFRGIYSSFLVFTEMIEISLYHLLLDAFAIFENVAKHGFFICMLNVNDLQ